MAKLLEVKGLKKYFNTPKGMLHAVDNINFTLDQGKTLGIVGESGCGKSTLGRVLLHLLEPTEGGTLLIGSSRRFDGYNIQNDDRVIRAMVQRVCRFFPKLADIHMIRCYAGLRPYTADHRPILSATPVEGFYIASGHEGSGIALSVITGLLMDELLCGRPLSLDLEPYCFSRFQEKVSGQTGGYARMNM